MTQDGGLGSETPHILGVRENSEGLDLNRDAVKLTTVEGNGLYWHDHRACGGAGPAERHDADAVPGRAQRRPQRFRSRSGHPRAGHPEHLAAHRVESRPRGLWTVEAKCVDGEYQSAGKIDLLAYRTNEAQYRQGTSLLGTKPGTASDPPEVVRSSKCAGPCRDLRWRA